MSTKLSSLSVRKVFVVAAASIAMLGANSAAIADIAPCRSNPGMLAFVAVSLSPLRPQCAIYQGDYMVNQGPVFSGPAVIAPQHTYAPTPTAFGYRYVSGYSDGGIARHATTRVVNVPTDEPAGEGAAQIVRARAEVRIYSPQRMDIRLFRD